MRITVIGCGGTGGYVVPNLLRLMREAYPGSNQMYITFVDGDVVSNENIVRQNFCLADLGRYKSMVLADRYAVAFGMPLTAITSYLTEQNRHKIVSGEDLIIACVDNNETRRLLLAGSYSWICDVGNELNYGQVFTHKLALPTSTAYNYTDIRDIHPEIMEEKKGGCARNTGQSFMINYMASMATLIMVKDIIHLYEGDLGTKMPYFELLFNTTGHISKRMCVDYPRYAKQAKKIYGGKEDGKQKSA